MTERDAPAGSRLGIRSRQTFGGDARPTLDLHVLCPRRVLDVPLDECARCEDCGGLQVAGDGREAFVVCEVAVDEMDAATKMEEDGPADHAPISSIMTTRVICVGPELPLAALQELFLDSGISGTPVVDKSGRPVGMVSKTDLIRHHQEQRGRGDETRVHVVADIMMPVAFCLPANETIAKAAALMAFESMHRLPIVNTHFQVVGVVSPLDVMRWMARRHGYVIGPGPREDSRPPAPPSRPPR